MKKIISLVLVVALAMSMMVMAVSAEEPVDYYTRGDWAVEIAEAAGADLSTYVIEDQYVLDDMVGKTDEVAKAVAWGVENKIIKGYLDHTFQPDRKVVVKEAMAMLTRALQEEVLPAIPVSGETVDSSVASYGEENVAQAAVAYGLVSADVDWSAPMAKEPAANAAVKANVVLDVAAGKVESAVAENKVKFYLGVLSGDGFVKATVYESYAMLVEVAKADLKPTEVKLEVEMNNVESLGGGVKKHTQTITTDIGGTPSLETWLKAAFEFEGANITINMNDEVTCGYTVQGAVETETGVSIAFVPNDIAKVREAWHTLVNEEVIAAGSKADANDEDSYIVIANGSSLVIGKENLCFENAGVGDLKLDDFSNIEALKKHITDTVKVAGYDADNKDVIATLTEGTALAVGNSEAVLKQGVEIKISGVDMNTSTLLGDLRDVVPQGNYAIAENLIGVINDLIAAIDEAENVTVDVKIG